MQLAVSGEVGAVEFSDFGGEGPGELTKRVKEDAVDGDAGEEGQEIG